MKDYIVQVKIKNGYLLRIMRDRGISVVRLHEISGVHKPQIYNALNLKEPALRRDGQFREPAKKIAAALGVTVWDIYPPQHFDAPLEKNTGEAEMSFEDVQAITQDGPDRALQAIEAGKLVETALGGITERSAEFVRLRYGVGCDPMTYGAIGERYGISTERVRQIIAGAEHRLKHPSRNLRDAFDAVCR